MKISPLLVTAVVGKPAEEGIAPRFSTSDRLASQAITQTISIASGLFNTIAQKASPSHLAHSKSNMRLGVAMIS
ncbi:unnamed protein product [Oikopleura dioica]|uniref:Uncharacterized protein n=1 Tax=Oikopleura dioica TaxID=34765 RepID=E4XZQ0_OIKDI|nr:unnamed protein product [Oikopleura dioica]